MIPFRIPAPQDADPKLPPASSGRVVAFKRPGTTRDAVSDLVEQLVDEGISMLRATGS